MTSDHVIDLYTFRTLTNLHAGAGDVSYGIVDKEVQKDPLDELPIVHSSGLKGAFRELFAHYFSITDKKYIERSAQDYNHDDKKRGDGHDHEIVENIFGADTSARIVEKKKYSAGSHLFFDARLLSLPVRSNCQPFFLATSLELMEEFIYYLEEVQWSRTNSWKTGFKNFSKAIREKYSLNTGGPVIFGHTTQGKSGEEIYLENFTATKADVTDGSFINEVKLFGDMEQLALFAHNDLKKLAKALPVIARNQLENGMSKNLWYEEVVPRETRFYTFISRPEKKENGSPNDLFSKTLDNNNKRVQVGGNATIGYGQCIFENHNQ